MMPRKSDIRAYESQKIFISSKYANKLELPQKAIGVWVIAKVKRRYFRLRKVRLDGYLASDKGNNFQNISKEKFSILKIFNEDEKFYWVFYGLSKRKTEWLKKLLSTFEENNLLSEVIAKFGKYQIARQILFDTGPQKGRIYSSIKGAVEYWEKHRLQNYEPNWE